MRTELWKRLTASFRHDPEGKAGASPKRAFPWALLILGLTGVLLLSVGDCTPDRAVSSSSETSQTDLTLSLTRLVSAISGDGSPVVTVTYARAETVDYAFEERQTANGTDRSVALYEDASGRDNGLIRTVYSPEVAGIAIVCENGEDASVRIRITEAVSIALRIGSDRVYVTAKRV